jgi:hypothetical protein
MPMLVLATRIEMELIFKNAYHKFFSTGAHDIIAMKLINDVITNLLDPNLYYSRFSFLESNKEAIDIKFQVILNILTIDCVTNSTQGVH